MNTTIIINNTTYVRETEVFIVLFCFIIIFFTFGYLFKKKELEQRND